MYRVRDSREWCPIGALPGRVLVAQWGQAENYTRDDQLYLSVETHQVLLPMGTNLGRPTHAGIVCLQLTEMKQP